MFKVNFKTCLKISSSIVYPVHKKPATHLCAANS
jgi:hypothetical protein